MAFWWVNQKQSYRQEREGGYMWAPLLNVAGQALSHWESMTGVRPGDIVFHHARGVRAVGTVLTTAAAAPMPPELPSRWERDGRLVKVDYADIAQPVTAEEIPLARRISERGPFASTGRVNQGYPYQLSTEFGEWFLETFRSRLGEAAAALASDDRAILPADPALRRAVEVFAIDTVVEALEGRFGAARVRKMRTNNPGYDIEVDRSPNVSLSVEVKGTQRMAPVFLMSETERAYSADNAERYELHVVWGIDLGAGTSAGTEVRSGAVTGETHGLTVQRWQGRLARPI